MTTRRLVLHCVPSSRLHTLSARPVLTEREKAKFVPQDLTVPDTFKSSGLCRFLKFSKMCGFATSSSF